MIPAGKVIAGDCESTGLSWRNGDAPYCFSFCNEKGDTEVISFPVDPMTRKVQYSERLEHIKRWAEDPTITKIFHNAQFDVGMIESIGIKVKGPIVCTMNLIRLALSNAPMKLKPFCKEYLGIGDDDESELKEAVRVARREGRTKGWKLYGGDSSNDDGALAADYWLAPRSIVEAYARTDAARAMAVYLTLYPEIKKNNLEKLWNQEQKTWRILRKIEKRGIRVYPEKIKETIEKLKKKLQTYQTQANYYCPPQTNLSSSLQLRKIFYETLKELPRFLTPSGLPSTDVDALRSMKHPLAKLILSTRACSKTIEFMEQYKKYMVNHLNYWAIHPTIHQARTVTGRESCSAPNLQQVASGRNDKGIEVLVEARSIFGPRPHYQMRSYDWKNIEVFIPAFAAKETKLTDVLLAGGDVHQNTSEALTALLEQPINRDQAKRIFFGLLYGIGSKKLAKMLSLEKDLADQVVWGFKREYQALDAYMEELKNDAASKGYVTTAYGRVIRLDSQEYYKAPNYYVQGTAGGVLRSAKIKIMEAIEKRRWDVHVVMPIHDELLVEIGDENVNTVDRMIVRCMQDNPELKMPMKIPVSISAIGKHWADKKKVKTL